MPLRIERTPQSKRDLFAIWDYVSPESVRGAERLIRRIDEIVRMLEQNPSAGRISPVSESLRYFPLENYLIFYRHTDTALTIIRILHAARDITPGMLDD